MLGINERHVCVCKGEQQRVSGWSLTPILTHQYVTVAHFNALQRSPALHCVYKMLYCMPCIAKGWDLRQAQLMSGQRVSLCQRKAEPPAFSPREWLLKKCHTNFKVGWKRTGSRPPLNMNGSHLHFMDQKIHHFDAFWHFTMIFWPLHPNLLLCNYVSRPVFQCQFLRQIIRLKKLPYE